MATIICSHGFGVRADARGMFTEIARAFPEHTFLTFDYNRIHPNGDIEVRPIDEQVETLQQKIDANDDVILLAHSQGCITAGLADLAKVSKAVLLAPPTRMSIERVMQKLMSRPGSAINLGGVSSLMRSDGSKTLIPGEYIASVGSRDPFAIYQDMADRVDTTIIRALDDEVVGLTNVDEITHANHVDLEADHNFTGDSRSKLIATLAEIFN